MMLIMNMTTAGLEETPVMVFAMRAEMPSLAMT